MQPLLHFAPGTIQKCNPYCILEARGFKIVTPIAFWGPGPAKMQPLPHFGTPGLQKCNPYYILGPPGFQNATPITLWGPEA